MATETKDMDVDYIDGLNRCTRCGQRAGVDRAPESNDPTVGRYVHDRTGRVDCAPHDTDAQKLRTILVSVRPRAYAPIGEMADRITRRLVDALTKDGHADALRLAELLGDPWSDTKVYCWADELTAPRVHVEERREATGVRVWYVMPAAAGVVYSGDQWSYWPDRDHDPDLPGVPISLGVDGWCLNLWPLPLPDFH